MDCSGINKIDFDTTNQGLIIEIHVTDRQNLVGSKSKASRDYVYYVLTAILFLLLTVEYSYYLIIVIGGLIKTSDVTFNHLCILLFFSFPLNIVGTFGLINENAASIRSVENDCECTTVQHFCQPQLNRS